MLIEYNKIILRDMNKHDIDDYIKWDTVDTEWQDWDAPWLKVELSKEVTIKISKDISKKYMQAALSAKQTNSVRKRFEICINNDEQTHIGWVNRYYIDENFQHTKEKKYVAVGLDIPPINARGNGYGHDALVCFVNYLLSNNIENIYTQTWSGNLRMIRLAEKIGFEECNRIIGARTVNGVKYDALTFKYVNGKYDKDKYGKIY